MYLFAICIRVQQLLEEKKGFGGNASLPDEQIIPQILEVFLCQVLEAC